jgi:hypothetical protein
LTFANDRMRGYAVALRRSGLILTNFLEQESVVSHLDAHHCNVWMGYAAERVISTLGLRRPARRGSCNALARRPLIKVASKMENLRLSNVRTF